MTIVVAVVAGIAAVAGVAAVVAWVCLRRHQSSGWWLFLVSPVMGSDVAQVQAQGLNPYLWPRGSAALRGSPVSLVHSRIPRGTGPLAHVRRPCQMLGTRPRRRSAACASGSPVPPGKRRRDESGGGQRHRPRWGQKRGVVRCGCFHGIPPPSGGRPPAFRLRSWLMATCPGPSSSMPLSPSLFFWTRGHSHKCRPRVLGGGRGHGAHDSGHCAGRALSSCRR